MTRLYSSEKRFRAFANGAASPSVGPRSTSASPERNLARASSACRIESRRLDEVAVEDSRMPSSSSTAVAASPVVVAAAPLSAWTDLSCLPSTGTANSGRTKGELTWPWAVAKSLDARLRASAACSSSTLSVEPPSESESSVRSSEAMLRSASVELNPARADSPATQSWTTTTINQTRTTTPMIRNTRGDLLFAGTESIPFSSSGNGPTQFSQLVPSLLWLVRTLLSALSGWSRERVAAE